tara:strand:- start:863 stop:1048 length:186 start_codon:yes stop_codon:yes gene_type:complete
MTESTQEEKEAQREVLAKDIKAYLARGGVIKKYPYGKLSPLIPLREASYLSADERPKAKKR